MCIICTYKYNYTIYANKYYGFGKALTLILEGHIKVP